MITPTVFEIFLQPDQDFTFSAGQFISVVVPGAGPGGRDLRRAYSIASQPDVRPIELCVKWVQKGPGTNYLYNLGQGEQIKTFAPYGDFVYKPKAGRHVCFISTGTGLAPFRSMIQSSFFKEHLPLSTTCLFGVNSELELLYTDEFTRAKNVKFVASVSRPNSAGWSGFKGRVTDYLRTMGTDYPWKDTDYYLCGNGAMIDEVKEILKGHGVEKPAIHQEVYYKPPKEIFPN